MKRKTQNATVCYDPVAVGENAAINFTRVTNAAGTTVYGKVMKEGIEVAAWPMTAGAAI